MKNLINRLIISILFLSSHLSPILLSAETAQNLDSQIQTRNQQIQKLLSERKKTLTLIKEIKQREWGVLELLGILNKNIKINRDKLDKIFLKLDKLQIKFFITSARIRKIKEQISQDQTRINQQLYILFRVKKSRKLTQLIGLASFKNYFRNQRLLQKSMELNAHVLARLNSNLKELEDAYNTQERQKAQLEKLREAGKEQKKLMTFELQQQRTYLQHIRQDRDLRVKYLGEIQVQMEQLNDMIYSMEKEKENEKKSKRFRGLTRYEYALPSPVKGKLVHRFGQKDSPFYTLFKNGVVVETVQNEEVRSILPGKVAWSGPMRGYQNLVILDHGRGSLSVYGNLDELFVIIGDVIEQNYVIGTVAFNQIENRHLFYFETRFNKRWVNPMQWLKKPPWK